MALPAIQWVLLTVHQFFNMIEMHLEYYMFVAYEVRGVYFTILWMDLKSHIFHTLSCLPLYQGETTAEFLALLCISRDGLCMKLNCSTQCCPMYYDWIFIQCREPNKDTVNLLDVINPHHIVDTYFYIYKQRHT